MSVNALPIDTDCEELGEGAFLLRVRGEIDMATTPLVDRALEECIESEAVQVFVEMSEVTFIDATGLRSLNDYGERLHDAGGELLVSRPSWQVRRVLEVAHDKCRLRIAEE